MRAPTAFQVRNPSGAKVWKADIQTGIKPNGKPRMKRVTAPTKKEVLEKASEVYLRALNGELAPQGHERFETFADRWLNIFKAPQARTLTTEDYRYKLDHWIIPVFGHQRLDAITTSQISQWLQGLSRSGYSNATINGVRQVLGAVMKFAAINGVIAKNPVVNTPVYRRDRRHSVNVQEPWNPEEARAALAAVKSTPSELFGTLLLYFGLRKSEAIGLKWSDFNFEALTFTIRRSIREAPVTDREGKRRYRLVEDEPKTASSRRTLKVSRPVVDALMRHREAQQASGHFDPTGWVFTSSSGGIQSPSSAHRRLQRILAANGIRRIRIHDIRHTSIILALGEGTPIEAVSQGAGHSRLDTTKSIYAPYVQSLADRYSDDLSRTLNPSTVEHELEGLISSAVVDPPGLITGGGAKN